MLRISEQFHASDLGRQRQGNEDNYFVRAPLFVVADGMGGAQAGEVASEMAVESFDNGLPDGNPSETLAEVIRSANRRIHDRSRSDEQAAGMGTTFTAPTWASTRSRSPTSATPGLPVPRRPPRPDHARPFADQRLMMKRMPTEEPAKAHRERHHPRAGQEEGVRST